MWDNIGDIEFSKYIRTIELHDQNIQLHYDICCLCNNINYSLEFKEMDNHICMDCLVEVINRVKLYSKIEENNLLKSSKNIESFS